MKQTPTPPCLVQEDLQHIAYEFDWELPPVDAEGRSLCLRLYYDKQTATAYTSLTLEEGGSHTAIPAKFSASLWREITGHRFDYPFKEGDTYYTVEDGQLIASCWDSVSEEMHDADPHTVYFRLVVVEHDIVTSEGEPMPPIVLNGIEWGDDFHHLASLLADHPISYPDMDGRCPRTGARVRYTQTFLRTSKSDAELLQEYAN